MSNHTPGPWTFGIRRDRTMYLSLGDFRTGPHFQGDLCASEADARLIVAAPDLLAACRMGHMDIPGLPAGQLLACANLLRNHGSHDLADWLEIKHEAEMDAIAAAEGRDG